MARRIVVGSADGAAACEMAKFCIGSAHEIGEARCEAKPSKGALPRRTASPSSSVAEAALFEPVAA
jgi:hypothetical protein